MSTSSQGNVHPRGLRRRLVMLALGVGVGLGVLAAPLPAFAAIKPPPPGGWCYDGWYEFGADYGQVHQRYGTGKHFDNRSSSPATWSEQIQVNTTFRSTYTESKKITGGVNIGVIKAHIEFATQVTTYTSITVNKTTGFSVPVPAQTMMYAEYGAYGRSTSGTYYSEQYECGTGNFSTRESAGIEAFSVTSEGWRLWEA